MSVKLPLFDLYNPLSKAIVSDLKAALYQFGAFRLVVPETTRHRHDAIIENAREFFKQPMAGKANITDYSPLRSERVRGRTEIPKESIYFFHHSAELKYPNGPCSTLYSSVKLFNGEWTPVRLHLLETVSQVLNANIPLRGTTLLDSVTVGIHHYDSRNLSDHSAHFNPPHMDSGTFTILFRSHHENDGLEIADLETTKRKDSEGVGAEASFIPVPTAGDGIPEVVVFAGTRLQRILGRDQVRACVHRVRGPGLVCCRRPGVQRISMAMFCAPAPRSSE